MQTHDPSPSVSSPISNHSPLDPPTTHDAVSNPIHNPDPAPRPPDPEPSTIENSHDTECAQNNGRTGIETESRSSKKAGGSNNDVVVVRRERPSRACTARAKMYVEPPLIERRPRPVKKEKVAVVVAAKETAEEEEEGEGEEGQKGQCGKIVTPLLSPPSPGQLPRWNLRAMWELASILNFFNVFRPILNIRVEFSAEELETALITPNNTLSDIHIPLLKAIPPVTRMACGRETWVTVLCRKLRDWWHWVAEGEVPIVSAHGAEVVVYKSLDPSVRVVILKALCDIRVEQDDIRSYIDYSMKQGIQLSAFRKERIGGASHGISYWYEDDPIVGHRLYREIRTVEVTKSKIKGSNVLPNTKYKWETVATNLDEFQDVSERLFTSKNRSEASLGKKLTNDMLPEICKIHKRKEKLLKKQQREALLLDSFVSMDGIVAGRSLRDRKPVTYTFDDYDRSINEAIKITKRKQPSPEPGPKREVYGRSEPSANGRWRGPSPATHNVSFSPPSPPDYDEMVEDHLSEEPLDRSNRRRQRPQRYSEKEFVEGVSDNEDFDSDDDIVGEAVYDEDYLKKRKERKKLSSSSEGDEEYHWSEENGEDEEETEEDSLSMSEDSNGPQKFKKLPGCSRREMREIKLRSVDELQAGLRRSKRSTRNRINYRQYETLESDLELPKQEKPNALDRHSDRSENEEEYLTERTGSEGNDDMEERGSGQPPAVEGCPVEVEEKMQLDQGPTGEPNSPTQEEGGVGKRRYLDLNELAPGSNFDDGPSALVKGEDKN